MNENIIFLKYKNIFVYLLSFIWIYYLLVFCSIKLFIMIPEANAVELCLNWSIDLNEWLCISDFISNSSAPFFYLLIFLGLILSSLPLYNFLGLIVSSIVLSNFLGLRASSLSWFSFFTLPTSSISYYSFSFAFDWSAFSSSSSSSLDLFSSSLNSFNPPTRDPSLSFKKVSSLIFLDLCII